MVPEVEPMLVLEALAAIGCVAIVWVILSWVMRPRPVARVWLILPLFRRGRGSEDINKEENDYYDDDDDA